MTSITHQGIRDAIRRRIVGGEWQLGDLIPGEVEFAEQYNCSRTTVNRAIRALADEGIVERKRKGGTRILPLPAPQAQVQIPIVREQVEGLGHAYSSAVLEKCLRQPPGPVRETLRIGEDARCVYLESLHLADGAPFAFEERWVNLETVPTFVDADLTATSANEWLVRTVPFSRGDVVLTATSADEDLAQKLGARDGAALFTMRRTTWLGDCSVTTTNLFYRQGYGLEFTI